MTQAGKNFMNAYEVEKSKSWNYYAAKSVLIRSLLAPAAVSFPTRVTLNTKKHDKREPGLVKKEIGCTKVLNFCSKSNCCYNSLSENFKFKIRELNKPTFKECGDGPMAKYLNVLEETENVTSTNRGFRTKNHRVATYEQTKTALFYIHQKRIVESDGFHNPILEV